VAWVAGLVLACSVTAQNFLPSTFRGGWIGELNVGAGFTDLTRASSIVCVSDNADIVYVLSGGVSGGGGAAQGRDVAESCAAFRTRSSTSA
jgi:hypothetical protein